MLFIGTSSSDDRLAMDDQVAMFVDYARRVEGPVRAVPLNHMEHRAAHEAVKRGLARIEGEGLASERFFLV